MNEEMNNQSNPVQSYSLKADEVNAWIDLARNGKVHTIILQEQQLVALCSAALRWLEYRDRVPSALLLPTRDISKINVPNTTSQPTKEE